MYKVNCTVLYDSNCDGSLSIVNVITKRNKCSPVSFEFMRGKCYTSMKECDTSIRNMLKQNNLYVGKVNSSGDNYWSEIMYLSTDGCATTYLIKRDGDLWLDVHTACYYGEIKVEED